MGEAGGDDFSADPRALRRRRFRRARTVTLGEDVQMSSATSRSQLASREAARCRSGVVVAAREWHLSCSLGSGAPAAAFCCPDPTRTFLGATAPREGSAALGRGSAIPTARVAARTRPSIADVPKRASKKQNGNSYLAYQTY